MRTLPSSEASIAEAISILRSGGIIAHATETCYGLACDLSNAASVDRLFTMKKRSPNQPISALFPSIEAAKNYVEWTQEAEDLVKGKLPGPLTLILRLRSKLPTPLYPTPSGGNTLGIRISSHPTAQTISSECGTPLSTTSANIHGQPNPYSAEEVESQFRNELVQPDLILDAGTLPHVPPSTIINLTKGGAIQRQGSIQA